MDTNENNIGAEVIADENGGTLVANEDNAVQDNERTAALEKQLEQQLGQIEDLNIRLFDAKTRLALLLSGIAKEKLDESAALVAGICKSGKTPEEAAAEIAGAYPHLRAIQREIPQFAASASGANDGFTAIRNIFAKR